MKRGVCVLLCALLSGACQAPREWPAPRPQPETLGSAGNEIMVAGERFDIGTRVVLWFEEPRYSAYATGPRFKQEGPSGLRYQPGRTPRNTSIAKDVRRTGWNLANLRQQVDLFVLHYDVCGTSKTCFKVLQDLRQLSVHFLLDVDGTLYQTLDLRDQAWHASQFNPRSIGVEIAHIGAYPEGKASPLDEWYPQDAGGRRLQLPARLGDGGVRTPGFQGRPAREELVLGRIQGGRMQQFDYTNEQYEALKHLAAGLGRVFPRIAAEVPRDASGRVRSALLSNAELEAFSGILGHYHVSGRKSDPGPAMDWDGLLRGVHALGTRP